MVDNLTEVIINKDEIVWARLSQDTSTGRNLVVKFKGTADLICVHEELCGNFWELVEDLGIKTAKQIKKFHNRMTDQEVTEKQEEDSTKIEISDPDHFGKYKTVGVIKT
jgi:hypothetical protein